MFVLRHWLIRSWRVIDCAPIACEALGRRVESIQTIEGTKPKPSRAVDEERDDDLACRARSIRPVVLKSFQASGARIESIQTLARRSQPQSSRAVFDDRQHIACGPVAGHLKLGEAAVAGVVALERPGRSDPEHPRPVFIDGVDQRLSEICRIAGIKRQPGKRRWRPREEPRSGRAESRPDISLAVFEKRGDAVLRQTLGVPRVVAVPREPMVFTI